MTAAAAPNRRPRRRVWFPEVADPGTEVSAALVEQRFDVLLRYGDHFRADLTTLGRPTLVRPFVQALWRVCQIGGPVGSRSTAQSYLSSIRRFWAYLDDRHPTLLRLEDLTPAHVNGFETWMRDGRYTEVTAYQSMARVTTCLRVIHEEQPGTITPSLLTRLRHVASRYHGNQRRGLVLTAAALGAATLAGAAHAQSHLPKAGPNEPWSGPHPSAGPIRQGRGSMLDGKIAVVTGAARGIGRAIAVELAANGADIVAVDICGPVSPASDAKPATPSELDQTVAEIGKLGRRARAVRADIRDIAALRGIAEQTVKDFGKVDIVVADAAIQRWVPLLEMQDSDWRDVIDNNLNGTANTIRAFAPHMVERKSGRIIVLSSMQGKQGTKGASSYSASKWGILGLMKSAAMELGQYGITVNAILPGLVETPLTTYEKRYSHVIGEHRPNPPEDPSPEQAWEVRAPTVPLKVGWLQPEDISPVAVFLASDAAAMVTGADYEVTAGDSAKDV